MMTKKQPSHLFTGIGIVGIIIIGAISGILYFKKETPPKDEPATVQPTEPAILQEQTLKESSIIDYQKIETDQELKSLMEQRKSEYGINKSLDMILTPDETLTIGGVTVPMKEILDKIRIQKGQVIESDLSALPLSTFPPVDKDRFRLEYMKLENRSVELVKLLINPDISKDRKTFLKYAQEYSETIAKLKDFRQYQDVLTEIEKSHQLLKLSDADIKKKILDDMNISHLERDRLHHQIQTKLYPDRADAGKADDSQTSADAQKTEARYQELETFIMTSDNIQSPDYSRYVGEHAELKDIHALSKTYIEMSRQIKELKEIADKEVPEIRKTFQEKINKLAMIKEQLEKVIASHLLSGKRVEVYGIYVVQPQDNIWNIHFNFLKEYFQTRQIQVSPKADEPDETGQSSGIGKILKFSEKMVYIFNVKDTNLSYDLNLIHPLSKIVIFNMGQALSLLEQIDFANIKHIRFDGDRLWLPAEG